MAQALLRLNDERHWLRAAPARVGHLFPRLLSQSECNQRLKNAAALLEAALRWLAAQNPANRSEPGTAIVTDKGLSGADVEQCFTGLDLTLVRPTRRDEETPRPFPNWLRQRIEAIDWMLR